MRIPTCTAVVLIAALTACTATQPQAAAAPPTDPPQASPPPPGASGKISADMVDKVSPVAAFRGLGEHFNIEIQSEGGPTADGLRHRVHLAWGMGTHEADGTLFYRDTPGPARGAPIALDGTLDTAKGKQAIRVEIVTAACTDDADVVHPQRVKIALQGESAMAGCGDLAVY
ncbi:MAG: hypothetical protein HOP03_07775 [Lysobacter sp.]|nr:hypothetical protein [Lysobacter sp.]